MLSTNVSPTFPKRNPKNYYRLAAVELTPLRSGATACQFRDAAVLDHGH